MNVDHFLVIGFDLFGRHLETVRGKATLFFKYQNYTEVVLLSKEATFTQGTYQL